MQSLYLLERVNLTETEHSQLLSLFGTERDEKVIIAIAANLLKNPIGGENIIKTLVFHPDNKIRNIGKYFWKLKWEEKTARKKISYIFKNSDYVNINLCDNLAELYIISLAPIDQFQKLKRFLKLNILNNLKYVSFPDLQTSLKDIIERLKEEDEEYEDKQKAGSPVIIQPSTIEELQHASGFQLKNQANQ
jgi:hypothetical protein